MTEAHMRGCPNCGHQLGQTGEKGFCSFVCKVTFTARQKASRARRRKERMRKLLADFHVFPLPGQQLTFRETGPESGR